jgi:hypothetical protein
MSHLLTKKLASVEDIALIDEYSMPWISSMNYLRDTEHTGFPETTTDLEKRRARF